MRKRMRPRGAAMPFADCGTRRHARPAGTDELELYGEVRGFPATIVGRKPARPQAVGHLKQVGFARGIHGWLARSASSTSSPASGSSDRIASQIGSVATSSDSTASGRSRGMFE